MHYGGDKSPNETEAVPEEESLDLGVVRRQKVFRARLHRLKADRRRLAEQPIGGHLVALVRDLDDPP